MTTGLEEALAAEMASWEAAGLRRELEGGASATDDRAGDFTSNDYLSLALRPEIVEAAREALAQHGVGGRASRLLDGGSPFDARAERLCADWIGAEGALLFPTGYQANLGVVAALAGPGDVVLSDELDHASLIDACRLSRAHVRVHRHLDLEHLEHLLQRSRSARRRVVLTEGVFSMDGDRPDLAALHGLCERHDAWLVVDEAHAAGLLGPRGAGAWAETGLEGDDASRLAARVVTGGKALGVSGAFVVGSAALREHLLNRARTFVFTTAVSPAISGALTCAIERAASMDEERERTLAGARKLASSLGLPEPSAAIVPFVVGPSDRTLQLADRLRTGGCHARAVRPPTVPPGTARLRLAAHAHNTPERIETLARLVREAEPQAPGRVTPAEASTAPPPLFVTGTDTGVGKTVVSALLVRAATRLGPTAYWKPVQTGDESDTEEVLRLAAGTAAAFEEPTHAFPLPASPHEAAAAAGTKVDVERVELDLAAQRELYDDRQLIVELAGGLLVPYDLETTQLDWLARERARLVLVARSGLGTLNHTLLSIEALTARTLRPRALFLVGERHESNRATLAHLAGVDHVFEVPPFSELVPSRLDRWLDANDLSPVFGR